MQQGILGHVLYLTLGKGPVSIALGVKEVLRNFCTENFFVPGQISVNLVPFEADVFGFIVRGGRPESWDDAGFGAFTAPGLGDIGILQQSIPAGFLSNDAMADQIADQFDLSGTWDIFNDTDGTLIFDVALHDDGDSMFIVVLITTDDVRDEYVDLVLYPALESIEAG